MADFMFHAYDIEHGELECHGWRNEYSGAVHIDYCYDENNKDRRYQLNTDWLYEQFNRLEAKGMIQWMPLYNDD